MPRALWFLQWLSLCSAVRRALRSLRTPKGIFSAVFWVLCGGMCLSSWVFSTTVGQTADRPFTGVSHGIELVERHGSLILLVLCLVTAVKTTGKGVIVAFAPAEVVFLVAGPFSRRQLLTYKFLQVLLIYAILSLGPMFLLSVLASIFNLPSGPWLARYLGVLFTLVFLKLVADDLTSVALIVGARAYNLWRRIVLWSVVASAVGCLLYVGLITPSLGWSEALDRLEAMPVVHAILQVPGVFLRAALSERYWPDFALWGGASLAIDAVLFWVLLKLDAVSIETAAAAGERLHAKLARIRAGEPVSILKETTARRRITVPDFPWWGGIGPLAWRQLLSVVRRRSLLYLFLLIPLAGLLLAIFLVQKMQASAGITDTVQVLPIAGLLLLQSLIVSTIYAYDFRRDFDRMEVLKSLPIGSAKLVLGQVLTPVLCTSIIQFLGALVLTGVVAGTLEAALVLWSVVLLGVPLSLLVVLLDNVVFLMSPSRPIATPGAQFSVLRILLNLAKLLLLYLACGVAGGVGTALYFLLGRQLLLAVSAAWLLLAAFAAALVPLAALLFRRYDVARERPA